MRKNILFLICCILLSSLNLSNVIADQKELVPLKKPQLSEKEKNKKISVNILKPLPKPKKEDLIKQSKKIVVNQKKEQKLKFLLPKKKPVTAGINEKKK